MFGGVKARLEPRSTGQVTGTHAIPLRRRERRKRVVQLLQQVCKCGHSRPIITTNTAHRQQRRPGQSVDLASPRPIGQQPVGARGLHERAELHAPGAPATAGPAGRGHQARGDAPPIEASGMLGKAPGRQGRRAGLAHPEAGQHAVAHLRQSSSAGTGQEPDRLTDPDRVQDHAQAVRMPGCGPNSGGPEVSAVVGLASPQGQGTAAAGTVAGFWYVPGVNRRPNGRRGRRSTIRPKVLYWSLGLCSGAPSTPATGSRTKPTDRPQHAGPFELAHGFAEPGPRHAARAGDPFDRIRPPGFDAAAHDGVHALGRRRQVGPVPDGQVDPGHYRVLDPARLPPPFEVAPDQAGTPQTAERAAALPLGPRPRLGHDLADAPPQLAGRDGAPRRLGATTQPRQDAEDRQVDVQPARLGQCRHQAGNQEPGPGVVVRLLVGCHQPVEGLRSAGRAVVGRRCGALGGSFTPAGPRGLRRRPRLPTTTT